MIEFLSVYVENWAIWWPQIRSAIWVTLGLTGFAYILALTIGMLVALGRMSNSRLLRALNKGYPPPK
jgi:ABC-type amino acid transport system permease subunit